MTVCAATKISARKPPQVLTKRKAKIVLLTKRKAKCSKYTLPLLFTAFEDSRCLCCSMPPFVVSLVSANISLSFNILYTPPIIFIAYQNCHHMTNNMTHKGNVNENNSFSVMIFKIGSFSLTIGGRGG